MSQICFKFHDVKDIDDNGFKQVYVQLTPLSGVEETSPQNSREARQGKVDFKFDGEDQIAFTLIGEPRNCSFGVKLFLKDENVVNCYDGIGTIKSMQNSDENSPIECTLYDNGDEDLQFGYIIYSWFVRDIDAIEDMDDAVGDTNEIEDEDEGGFNFDDSEEEEEDMFDTTTPIGSHSGATTPTRGLSRQSSSVPSGASTPKGLARQTSSVPNSPNKGFSRQMSSVPTAGATAPSRGFSRQMSAVPQQSHANTTAVAPEPSVVEEEGHASTKKTSVRPLWSKFDDYSRDVITTVKNDVSQFKGGSCNVSVKVHTAMCSLPSGSEEEGTSNNLSAQVKLSLQPIPGKGHILRTKSGESAGDGGISFDFGMQSVTMAMTAADLHSKAYISGSAPSVKVEFTCGGFSAVGSLYMPELMRQPEGKVIVLHMIPKKSSEIQNLADGTMYSWHDHTLEGNVSLILEVSRDYMSSGTAAMNGSVLGNSAKGKPPPVEVQIPSSEVDVHIKGIYGSGLKDISNCLVETSLTASGEVESSGVSTRAFRKGVSLNHKIVFQSDCADLDILSMKIYELDGDTPNSIGMVQIPLHAVIKNDSSLGGCFQAIQVEPPAQKGQKGVNKVSLLKWGLVCEVICQHAPHDDPADGEEEEDMDANHHQHLDDSNQVEALDELDPAAAESHIAKRNFEVVKSVDGQLSVSVHGFIPKYGGTCELAASDVLSIEFSLPNSGAINEKTEAVRVCKSNEHDKTSAFCALWEKEFLVPVVWALQQRFVGYLQGVVVRTTGSKGDPNRKKSIIGYITLDMASMVNMREKPIVCALPVVHKPCSHEDYIDSLGYVMLGLQFENTGEGHPRCSVPVCAYGMITEQENKKKFTLKKSVAWGDSTQAFKRGTGKKAKPGEVMSPLPLPPSAFSELKRLCLDRWPLFINHLAHEYDRLTEDAEPRDDLVAVSVSLNSIEAVAGPLRELLDEEVISVVVSSNEDPVNTTGEVDVETGKISLKTADLNIPLNLESNASILVSMKIVRNDDQDVLGVASVVLPRELVITGRPMNVAVPLRDNNGLKTAVIVCGCHFSSTGFNAITAPAPEEVDGNDSDFMLDVCVIEGSVRDGDWTTTMEPYFECALLTPSFGGKNGTSPPMHGISLQNTDVSTINCVGYTPTVDLNAPGDWNARCSIPIPKSALADGDSKPGSLWSLDVKCRDGSRMKYPHISQTQVSIPWSVLAKGKELDLWVTLVPTVNSSSVFGEDDIDGGDEDPVVTSNLASRLHVRLQRRNKEITTMDVDNTSAFAGVGRIAMWYHSIREGESHNEKTYGAEDIRSVDAAVEMSNPSTELYEYEAESIPFRSSTIETRQSIYEINHVANMLSGHVVVPGGRSVTHLRLRTKHERLPLLTSLPTFSTLPRPSQANPRALSTDIPIMETVLRPDSGARNHTSAIRQRLSRLKIGAVFVPYVSGFLYIHHSNLEIHDTAADRFESCPSKKGAFKYSLGGLGSCFSTSFQMVVTPEDTTATEGDDDRSHCSSLSSRTVPKSPHEMRGKSFKRSLKGHKAHSPVGTSNITIKKSTKASKLRRLVATQKGTPSPKGFTTTKSTGDAADTAYIQVNTFEMLSGLGKSSDDTFDLRISLLDVDAVGSRYCMGVGHLQTAAIYFQALRNIFNIENKNGIISRCTMPIPVKIFDPSRRVHIATVTITLKFELTAVSVEVINFLRAYKQSYCQGMSPGNEVNIGRAELGLKQAFQVADKDGNGGVSASELVATIRSITSKSNKGQIVGFDTGALRLLLSLMDIVSGPPPDKNSAYSEERIMQLFRTMDLDGDGSISWWEWRQVLDGTNTVLAVGEPQPGDPPRYIDSLDPLVVCLEAAHAALMAENGGIVKPKPRQGLDDDDLKALEISPTKKKSRYDEKLARLKSKNSRLQQKLEDALSSSQVMAVSPARGGHKTEQYDDEIRKMLDAEKKRRQELESEVDRLNNVSSEMVKSRSEGELERSSMQARLQAEANRLREEMILAYMGRKQFERHNYVLKRFFLIVRQKMLERRIEREKNKLSHAMSGFVTRKKYKEVKNKRNVAATKIQSQQRRRSAAHRVLLIKQSVRVIQEAWMMRKLRHAAQGERSELLRQLTLLKWSAASQIQKALKRKKEEKKRRQEEVRRCAIMIQSRFRGFKTRNKKDDTPPKEDNDEPMILHIVDKPPLEKAVGIWISHPRYKKKGSDENEREAIVVGVDLDTENMTVQYLEEDPVTEAVVYYNDPRITHWFHMSNPEEEKKEIRATIMFQAIVRGRLSRLRVRNMVLNRASRRIQAVYRGRRARTTRHLPSRAQEQAATRIQAIFRGRRDREKVRRLHASDDSGELTLLEMDNPPALSESPGHWIIRKGDEEREGLVRSVDKQSGLMTVVYDDEDGPAPEKVKVPYNEPELVWLEEEIKHITPQEESEPLATETAATRIQAVFRGRRDRDRVRRLREGHDGEEMELVEVDDPPSIDNCVGYWVMRNDGDDPEGHVESVNQETRVMKVLYEHDDESDILDEVDVPYDEANLVWLKDASASPGSIKKEVALAEEVTSPSSAIDDAYTGAGKMEDAAGPSPDIVDDADTETEDMELVKIDKAPSIDKCGGYWIIRADDEGGHEGLVDRVNKKTRMMVVMYEKDESESVDEVEVPYDEPGLVWLNEDEER